MATNPMQRKANNYLLIGVLVTLLITGSIIAVLLMQLSNFKKQQKEEAKKIGEVYVLNKDVKSGQKLTEDMFEVKKVNLTAIPSNATKMQSVISKWFIATDEGDRIYTDTSEEVENSSSQQLTQLYINKPDSIIEVYPSENKNNEFYYKDSEDKEIAVKSSAVSNDSDGYYIISEGNNQDDITRIYQTASENYYVYTYNSDTKKRERKNIRIDNVPLTAKVEMKKNTVITPALVAQTQMSNDLRKQEYNMIILQTAIQTGDYIDIRLKLPDGTDYIVISKKEVEIPNISGTDSATTIKLNVTEDEILLMSNAIVEAYWATGATLYATTYIEPGMQQEATPTYLPNPKVAALISSDPNIVQVAKIKLIERYNSTINSIRPNITDVLNTYSVEGKTNVESKMQEEANKARTERQSYLEALGGN